MHKLIEIIVALAATFILKPSVALAADGSPCAALTAANLKDEFSTLRIRNCQTLVARGLIPNQNAFTYTLQYLRDNYRKLADPSCAMRSVAIASHHVMNKDKVLRGIQNGCQFVINDTTSMWEGMKLRTPAYFVDLCSKNPDKVVRKFFMNVGTGPRYVDKEGNHSTVAGAFMTDSATYSFQPFRKSPGYRKIEKSMKGGRLPGLRLVGLNSSDCRTDFGKPLHVSPYQSSWGCPSVGVENADILFTLAEHGPSLVINYGPPDFHNSTTTCTNDHSTGRDERQSVRRGQRSRSVK
jgi:hypothetical protein